MRKLKTTKRIVLMAWDIYFTISIQFKNNLDMFHKIDGVVEKDTFVAMIMPEIPDYNKWGREYGVCM